VVVVVVVVGSQSPGEEILGRLKRKKEQELIFAIKRVIIFMNSKKSCAMTGRFSAFICLALLKNSFSH
jgi:hypothetical protein